MRSEQARFLAILGCAVIGVTAIFVSAVEGYDRWSINDDATNCGECHGDFRSNTYISPVDDQVWGNLHNIHRNDMLNGDCEVCHMSGSDFPVFLSDSAGGDGFESIGCMGCHGIEPSPGDPEDSWGAGLRLHHTNAGVPADNNGTGQTCVDCHADDPVPARESVQPSYYFLPDAAHPNKPTDPCNPAPGFPEDFAGLSLALDNDGDLLHDEADPDCVAGGEIFTDGFESGDTSAWSSTTP